jgi:hypothetical protein
MNSTAASSRVTQAFANLFPKYCIFCTFSSLKRKRDEDLLNDMKKNGQRCRKVIRGGSCGDDGKKNEQRYRGGE